MRITTNSLSTRLTSDLSRLSSTQSKLTEQMATGRKLNEASDDVPATGRVMSYETEQRNLQQYDRNAKRGITNIEVSSTALNSIKDIASQVFNLAPEAAASGETADQAALAAQVDGLLEQAFSLANNQVNGTYLFGAQETGSVPFSATRDADGKITAVSYDGDTGAAPEVAVSESATVATTTDGTQNQELETLLNNLVAMREAISADDKTAINSYQNDIGDDEDNLVTMLSTLSTAEFRIESTQEQNKIRFNQLADLAGDETDIDLAETIVKYQSAERAYESALQAGANLMQKSLLDYI